MTEDLEQDKTTTNADNSSISIDLNTPPSYDEGEGEGEGDVRDDKMSGCVTPNRVFSCNYCRRKFYSSQALGGHQNAHKRERTIAKRAMRIGVLADRHVSLASLPLYGCYSTTSSSSSRRPSIDIQAHHGSVTMMQHQQQQISTTILPHHHGGTPFHGLRGGPAKFQGQNGYCGNSNGSFLPAVPCWPGSFRRVDDEAHSSTNTGISSSNNNINNDVIRDDDNYYDHDYVIRSNNPHHLDKPDSSSPDLTLKL